MKFSIVANLVTIKNKPHYQYLLLILAIVLAGGLRFYKLGEWGFWGDEMFTVGGREDGFNYTFARQSLSLYLIQTTVSFLGISEWSARLVPALIGTISVPFLYFPTKKMFGPAVSLIAAVTVAISPWHLYWSQNSRFYVALLLFYTLALFTFYFGIEEDRPEYLVASLVLLGLATKERLIALFFVPVVIGYLVLLKVLPFEKPAGLRWRNLAIFFLPGLGLALFFAGPYVANLSRWMTGFGYGSNNAFRLMATVIYYVGIPTVVMGTVGALYLLVQKSRASLLLSLSATIPLLTMMGISSFHYTASRYIFISLMSWIILASFAIVELFFQSRKQIKILALGAALFFFLQPMSEDVLYYRYQNGNRDNWKAAFDLIKSQKEVNDVVATVNPELADFYMQDKTVNLSNLDLAPIESRGGKVWIVEDMVARQALPNLDNWLAENAQLVANFDVHAQARTFIMRVYLCDTSKNLAKTVN